MTILSINDFLELANSSYIRIPLFVVFLCLVTLTVLFVKEQLELRKRYKSLVNNKIKETPASLNMTIDELIEYFKTQYGFKIDEDSYLFVDKAKELVAKIEQIELDLNNDLLAMQTGVVVNNSEIVSKINEASGLISVIDSELELMVNLFNHLKEHDDTYHEELEELDAIKIKFHDIEKRLLGNCLSLISEFPNN